MAGASRAVTLAGLVGVVGLLPWLGGRDPALAVLRATSADREPTAEALAAVRTDLGLDAGPAAVLAHWLAAVLRGDFGVSWVSGTPVLDGVLVAARVSATLAGFATLVALAVMACVAAPVIRRGLAGPPPRPSGRPAAALVALPEFLLAALLLVVVSVQLGWAPPYGWEGPHHAVLPAVALGLPAGGLLGGLLADAVAQVFAEPWTSTWRAAGVSRPRLAAAALRRAVPGLAGQGGLVVVGLTGGAVGVEKVFAVPGLGRATLGAAAAGDLPALQAGVLVLVSVAVVAGLAATALRTAALGPAGRSGTIPVPIAVTNATPTVRGPLVAVAVLLVVLAAGLPRDPYRLDLARLQPPDVAHPLGADSLGRDLLARVAHGAGSTIAVALGVTVACLAVGLMVGLLPVLSTGPIEVANALPPVVTGMVVAAVAGPGRWSAALAVTVVGWAPLAAHTASLVVEASRTPYAVLAPVLGTGRWRLLLRDVLPGVVPAVARHAVLRLPGYTLSLAALGFLGLGSVPPQPDWGAILAEGMPYVERAPWTVLVPTAGLVLLAIAAQAPLGGVGRAIRGQ